MKKRRVRHKKGVDNTHIIYLAFKKAPSLRESFFTFNPKKSLAYYAFSLEFK